MNFKSILEKCKGETVVVNNAEERTLIDVAEDFIVLQGGNTQMKLIDFVPFNAIVKVIRAEYATGAHSISLDLTMSAGDQRRSSAH